MGNLRKDLPLLKSLVAFEASCRNSNFTRAAEEIGITRVAISRQISDLERDLGHRLFVRSHRKVELTAMGEALADSVLPPLRAISEALSRQRSNSAEERLSVTVTTAFATYWLMPRLVKFGSRSAEMGINVVVSDRYLDLASEGIDVAIRYLISPIEDGEWRPLMQEEIFPVYSPKYEARTRLATSQDLLSECLLLLSGNYRAEARWDNWFRQQGLKAPAERSGIQVNTYINMLQAAIEGQGIALAGHPLVTSLLENGTLIQMPSVPPLKREFYYVLNRSKHKHVANQFYDWLFEIARDQ